MRRYGSHFWVGWTVLSAALCVAPAWGQAPDRTPGPHGDLVCVACHDGALSDRALPHVSVAACTECHQIESTPTGAWGFEHGQHQDAALVPLGCAGCHAHASGLEELGDGRDSCELCHRADLEGSGARGCQACHQVVRSRVRTSQGVTLRHGFDHWGEEACLRCHYQVSTAEDAPDAVLGACEACHADLPAAQEPESVDLHGAHVEVSCGACHSVGEHRIQRMSSAVDLSCGDCHAPPHGLAESAATTESGLCNACHEGTHAAQQELLLGSVTTEVGALVAEKFLTGLSCRSCHGSPSGLASVREASSCGACHPPEYGRVAEWWTVGGRARAAQVRRFLGGARTALGDRSDTEAALRLNEAGTWVDLVSRGGSAHNPTLSHRLLSAAVQSAVDGYLAAGAIVPPVPFLGTEPRAGRCAYCHYNISFEAQEPTRGPADGLHRETASAFRGASRIRRP